MIEVDDQSLETVSAVQSAEVSPVKFYPRVSVELPDGTEQFKLELVATQPEVQSNQQDSGQALQEPMETEQNLENPGAGWEGDESLEEIDVES